MANSYRRAGASRVSRPRLPLSPEPLATPATKPAARKNGKVDRVADIAAFLSLLPEPKQARLKVTDLTLHPEYCRQPNLKRLEYLRKAWSPAAMGSLAVVHRPDGTLVCMDGNHRAQIAREKGTPDLVNVLVWDNLTSAQEPLLYHAYNNALAQSVADLFRAEFAWGEPLALAIDKEVRKAGFRLGDEHVEGTSHIRCIRTLQGIAVRYGVAHLYPTLKFFQNAFAGDGRAARDYAVSGVAAMLIGYGNLIDDDRLFDVAGNAGFKVLQGLANNQRVEFHVTMPEGYIRSLVVLYNKGLQGRRRLPEWSEVKGSQSLDTRTLRMQGAGTPRQAVWNDLTESA